MEQSAKDEVLYVDNALTRLHECMDWAAHEITSRLTELKGWTPMMVKPDTYYLTRSGSLHPHVKDNDFGDAVNFNDLSGLQEEALRGFLNSADKVGRGYQGLEYWFTHLGGIVFNYRTSAAHSVAPAHPMGQSIAIDVWPKMVDAFADKVKESKRLLELEVTTIIVNAKRRDAKALPDGNYVLHPKRLRVSRTDYVEGDFSKGQEEFWFVPLLTMVTEMINSSAPLFYDEEFEDDTKEISHRLGNDELIMIREILVQLKDGAIQVRALSF